MPKQNQASSGYFKPSRYPEKTGIKAGGIVEFDANQFDSQGYSSQAQLLAAQHHHMLMTAGQKQFPSQQQYGYGLNGQGEDDQESFSADEDEEDEENSDYEDGDLDSAQKEKLKRDLIMMGFGQNGEFEDEDGESEAVAQAFLASKAQDAARLHFIQQQQYEEAMRIQMAMKQMPIEAGQLAMGGAHMGLRMKANY